MIDKLIEKEKIIMLLNRPFQTLALTLGLLATGATASLADGVRVLNPNGSVRTEQASGYTPQGDVAQEVAAALGLSPNQVSYLRWEDPASEGAEGTHVLQVLDGVTPTTQAVPVPVSTPVPVVQATSPQGALLDILIILDQSGNEVDRMQVPTGTDHAAAAAEKHGVQMNWLNGGSDDRGGYTATLQMR